MGFVRIGVLLPARKPYLLVMLDALVRVNLLQLKQRPGLPGLYSGRVRYKREARGKETWKTLVEILASGSGDCEDLAAARVAELRNQGVNARIDVKRVSPRLLHIRVRHPDGKIEDPSAKLGMTGEG